MNTYRLFYIAGLIFCSTAVNIVFADTATNSSKIDSLPRLLLNDLKGRQHDLTEWRGRVIILNFWASWCGPCQIEIPHLIEYQSEYTGKGLQVIGIGLDETRKLNNYVRTIGINYPVLHANPQWDSRLLQEWGDTIGVLPYTVVINRNGQKVYSHAGIFSDEAFSAYVKPLLYIK